MSNSIDSQTQELRDQQIAFALFRLTMGINFFLHGATRIASGVDGFASKMSESFTQTPLPPALVWSFLAVLPFIEATIGLALIIGLKTRWAALSGGLLMSVLVFGTALRSDWGGLGTQMVYVLCFYFLISHTSRDTYGLDSWRRSGPASR